MKKKSALWITGASSGIGKETAKIFAESGYFVYASSRRKKELEKINLRLINGTVEIAPCDVSSFTQIKKVFNSISKNSFIECLINNAGTSVFKPVENTSINEINDIIGINLLGSIYAIKTVLPEMIKRRKGTIINISSMVVHKVFENSGVYAASKAGLESFSDALREEVRKYNIRVIDIIPGATSTNIWPPKVLTKYSDRMMKPEDVARAIYLLYKENSTAAPEKLRIRPIKGDL